MKLLRSALCLLLFAGAADRASAQGNRGGNVRGNGGNTNNSIFTPPGQDGGAEEPPSNVLFEHINQSGGKLKKAGPNGVKIKDSYVVVFDATTRDEDVGRKAREYTEQTGGRVKGKPLKLVRGFAAEMTEGQAIAMSQRSDVEYVEEDQEVHAIGATDLWGLDRIDQVNLPLDGMYDTGFGDAGGSGVVVYVIDTGVRTTHEQFGPFSGGQGRAYTSGDYDFIGDNGGGVDCHGHGTHCSGTVAGLTYGVAPGAHIVGVRVLSCSGSGSSSGVQAGMNKVAEDCPLGFATGPGTEGTPFAGKRCVASMSLGGGFSQTSNSAVANLRSKGVVVAVAAGNDNADACNYSPASAPAAFTVGSTTSSDARSSFSNYGTCVDIFAPGSSILSAVQTSDTASATWSGTSMATPHVAGVAAIILGGNPNLSADEVESKMLLDAGDNKISNEGTGSPNKLLHVDGICTSDAQCNLASNPCTTFTCNSGSCEPTYNNGDPCDDGNPCTNTECSAGSCTVVSHNNGDPCEDGNPCTNSECSAGSCTVVSYTYAACDDGNPCTSNDTCDANGQCGAGAWVCPGVAQYDPGHGVPACLGPGSSCEASYSQQALMGRGTVGPEVNGPNTLDGCADGNSGTMHSDESNDALKVHTVSGNDFAEGETVMITATVWAWSTGSSNTADFYYTADATNPTWVYITSVVPPGGGHHNLTATYTLPAGGLQAVRVNFRYSGSVGACSTGSYDDRDDLAFVVDTGGPTLAPVPTNAPTATPTTLPSASPSSSPTKAPVPTEPPTAAPTRSPSALPSSLPTEAPTAAPTTSPSASPSSSPTVPTDAPTATPTTSPSALPSSLPTEAPTAAPTTSPSASPSSSPTVPTDAPTATPTTSPSALPSSLPTEAPTAAPTTSPSASPSSSPTVPTDAPTATPTTSPSALPSSSPTAPFDCGQYSCSQTGTCLKSECNNHSACTWNGSPHGGTCGSSDGGDGGGGGGGGGGDSCGGKNAGCSINTDCCSGNCKNNGRCS